MARSMLLVTLSLAAFVSAPITVTTMANAQSPTILEVNRISDTAVGEKIGTITVTESKSGVRLKVAVQGLAAGQHGFHVHQNGDCGPAMKDSKMTAGEAAGGHYDPDGKKSHKGPNAAGHKGDLPRLSSTAQAIDQTVTAPRLRFSDIRARTLIIHEAGDNYSDRPENGGAKGRVACARVPAQ